MEVEGLEPTNNRAERALRPAVCMRKMSFGTHSQQGSQFIQRILTAGTTLNQQGRNVLEWLTAAMQAWRSGEEPPFLLLCSAMPLVPDV